MKIITKREYDAAYYLRTNRKKLIQAKKWRESHKEQAAKYNESYRREWRSKVLNHLGGKCCGCGFSDHRALQIDHVNGGGVPDRDGLIIGFYKKVIENHANKYQLLCANCNQIKKIVNKEYHKYYQNRP